MIISENKYQDYKKICIRLREFHLMPDKHPLIIEAIQKCEHTKSILDKLNPSYGRRFKNDNQQ